MAFKHGMMTLAVLATATSATAQTLPQPIPAPGRLEIPPTREEVERGKPTTPAPRASRLHVEGGIERAPCPLAEPRFAAVRVRLTSVTFDGLRAVPPEALSGSYEGQLGRTLPISVVCEIRDAAATMLRARGYLAAVQVPPQRIDGGVLHLQVLMARLVAIRVRGNAGRAERLIAAYLQPLTRQLAFNERDAERQLLLARDLPGFDVRLTLKPTEKPGEVVGEVTAVRTPLFVDFNIQNLGSNQVGRWGGLLRTQLNDVFGFGERTTIGFFATTTVREQKVLQFGEDIPLGGSGLGFGEHFTYAWTKPSIPDVRISTRTLINSTELTFPFVRRRADNLHGALGLDVVDQLVDVAGARLTTDRLRVLYARFDGDAVSQRDDGRYSPSNPRWQVGGSFELRRGLNVLGASQGCGFDLNNCRVPGAVTPSRPYGNPDAFVLRASASSEFRPTPRLSFALSPRMQYAPDTLLSFEEFSAGDYTVGRGYDPGTLLGDSGVGVSGEVRYGRTAPASAKGSSLQPFAFVDRAWVYSNDPSVSHEAQTLTSAGFGARGAFRDILRLDGTVAFPIERVGTQRSVGPVRFLVSITTRLWPFAH